jgi:hypothetical protein
MSCVIPRRVLSLAEWHVCKRSHDACTVLLRVFEVAIHVCNGYVNILGDAVGPGGMIGSALLPEHDGAFLDSELGMTNHPFPLMAKTF